MGAIENFLRRFGYAKVDRFGLVLTGDDRVLTTRPHILDDGLGGKIVGWLDGDLAAMELEHWGAPKRQPARVVAGKKVVQPPPRPVRATMPTPVISAPAIVAAPIVSAPPVVYAPPVVVAPPPVAVVAPVVAQEEPVEDDEWEWTIAMARARAAADEVEQQATKWVKPAATAPKKRKTSPGMPAVRAKTEPQPVVPPVRRTIIPVPSLSLNGQSPLRRAPRGTGPIEDTVRTQPAPPANDDTSPYVTLPAEVRPVGHAHTKRVAAKVR